MSFVTALPSALVSITLSASLALGSASAVASTPASEAASTPVDTGVTARERDEAEELSERAIEEFAAGNYAGAVDLFKQAHAIDPQPNYLFNIGRVYEEAGELENAVEFYARFVKLPGVEIESRELAVERLRVLRTVLDETTERKSEPDPDTKGLVMEPSGQPVDADVERKHKTMRHAGFGLAAVGAGTLISAAVVGGLASSDANRARDRDQTESLEARQELLDKARTKAVTADVLYGVGGALLVTGVVLIAVGYSKPKARRVAFTPTFGPRSSGFDLRVSF